MGECGVRLDDCDKIYMGSSVCLRLPLVRCESRRPYDLTGWTEITCTFPTPTGGFSVTASSGNPGASGQITIEGAVQTGVLLVSLTPVQSAGLLQTDNGSIQIMVDKGPNVRKIAQLIEKIPILPSLY